MKIFEEIEHIHLISILSDDYLNDLEINIVDELTRESAWEFVKGYLDKVLYILEQDFPIGSEQYSIKNLTAADRFIELILASYEAKKLQDSVDYDTYNLAFYFSIIQNAIKILNVCDQNISNVDPYIMIYCAEKSVRLFQMKEYLYLKFGGKHR